MLYNPEVLAEENIYILPADVQFAWFYCQAYQAYQKRNYTKYTHFLRLGVKSFPAMKQLVSFLNADIQAKIAEQDKNQSEFKTLAKQVRTILSAYPEDHPAALALKQSPVYQKIKDFL